MLGAILGDIVGSIYEARNLKSKEFPLFSPKCRFTDDSVMTLANASALICYLQENRSAEKFREKLIWEMKSLGRQYPHAGYGGGFRKWLASSEAKPYQSYGNGSAMRVSPVAWVAESLEEAEYLAEISAAVTHNHPEGIKGAKAVAAAIYLARTGQSKAEIKSYIETNYYALDFTLDEIRPNYKFDVTCQGSVPQAIVAFWEAQDLEDAIRNAVSIGGDSDTIAAIAGSMAEGFWGISEDLAAKVLSYLTPELKDIVQAFNQMLSK